MQIKSTSNSHVLHALNIKKNQSKEDEDFFLIEGEHQIVEAIKNKLVTKLFFFDFDKFPFFNGEKIYVTYEVIKKISSTKNPSDFVAICKKNKNKTIEYNNKVVFLDNVQDPGNVGTIIRSALAFNFNQIILSNESVNLYNDKLLRATQGAFFNVNIIQSDLEKEIKKFKENNYLIVGCKLGKDSKGIEEFNLNHTKFGLIFGNEGNGISTNILEMCDEYLMIPINNKVESLNVAVAASICMFAFNR
jgi:RNA methyltransferase, TrmH family